MFSEYQEGLFKLIQPEEIIDLDYLLLQLMKGNSKIAIAADVTGCLRDSTNYVGLANGDCKSPINLKTTLDGLAPISRQNKSIETVCVELPGDGIDIWRSSCVTSADNNQQTIVHLVWLPDSAEKTRLRVACETANSTSVWEYCGPWTIGELARLLLR